MPEHRLDYLKSKIQWPSWVHTLTYSTRPLWMISLSCPKEDRMLMQRQHNGMLVLTITLKTNSHSSPNRPILPLAMSETNCLRLSTDLKNTSSLLKKTLNRAKSKLHGTSLDGSKPLKLNWSNSLMMKKHRLTTWTDYRSHLSEPRREKIQLGPLITTQLLLLMMPLQPEILRELGMLKRLLAAKKKTLF